MSAASEPGRVLRSLGLLVLIGVAGPHAVGAALDAVLAIRFPFQIDYGEGIVWQQTMLIPGPRAYSTGTGLPFIVFHYPPLYYLLVQIATTVIPNVLAAGRTVAALSTLVLALGAGCLVYAATPDRGGKRLRAGCAISVTLLVLSVPNIRAFGFLMRVDMPANALGMLGLLVAFTGRASAGRTAAALALCTAAVFTKQTELASGITVFLVSFYARPRQTAAVAALVGAVAVLAVAALQWETSGGFLQNILFYNLNRYDWASFVLRLWGEVPNWPIMLSVLGATVVVSLNAVSVPGRCRKIHAALLICFGFNLISITGLAKSGANYNYLNSLYVVGCVVFGVALAHLLSGPKRAAMLGTALACGVAAWVAILPIQRIQEFLRGQGVDQQAALVQRIRAAEKPVASDDMTLTMLAGKQVLFESAIVTELAATGRWDETPLLDFIKRDGLAFVISEKESLADSRRSPRVLAALTAKFPLTERVTVRHWLHLPSAGSDPQKIEK